MTGLVIGYVALAVISSLLFIAFAFDCDRSDRKHDVKVRRFRDRRSK